MNGNVQRKAIWLWALVGLALPGGAAAQNSAGDDACLKLVPDQASCVFVVPNLEKAFAGVKAFGKAVGAPDEGGPSANDLLEEFVSETDGINLNGTFAFALWPNSKGPLLVCSLENAETWKKSNEAQEADGLLNFEVDDEPRVAAIKDKVLIVGRDKEAVESAVKSGGKFAGAFRAQAGGWAQKNHVVLYVDVPAWKPVIEDGLKEMAKSMESGMGDLGPQGASTAAMFKWVAEQARVVVEEHKTLLAGAHFDTPGIRLTVNHNFKSDGKIAGYLKKVRKPKADALRGLPEGRGFAIMGFEWETPEGSEPLSETLLKAMLEGPFKEKMGDEKFKNAVKQLTEMYRLVTGYNGILMMPPNGKGLAIAGHYLTKDAKAVMKQLQAVYDVSPELMHVFGGGMSMKFTRAQETIGPVQADVYTMTLETDNPQIKGLVENLYGDSPKFYVAPVADGVLYVMGSGDPAKELFEKTVTGKGGKLAETKAVATARGNLSPGPQICILLDLMRLADMGLGFAASMGAPIPPIKLPDTPPSYISMGAYLENETIRGELYISAETIKQIVDASKAMMGGGGGGDSY